MGWVADVFSRERLKRLPGPPRDRPRALLHRGRLQPAQRPAHHRHYRARAAGHRPQRQPRERRGAARGAREGRRGLPVVVRHRGDPPPDRARPRAATLVDQLAAGAHPRARAPTPCCSSPRQHDRRCAIRPASGRSPSGSSETPGCSPPRPARSTSWRPRYVRDVEPGEIVVIDDARRCTSLKPFRPRRAGCSASSSTSTSPGRTPCCGGATCTRVRKALGHQLAREYPVDADLVIPVPDSGVAAALGYAEESGLPVRQRARPQPLRRPHLHRAAAGHPPLRRQGEAQPEPRGARGQAGGGGGRLDRARHHQPQDREDGPRRGRARGARAHLVAADPVALLLRHRHARPGRS